MRCAICQLPIEPDEAWAETTERGSHVHVRCADKDAQAAFGRLKAQAIWTGLVLLGATALILFATTFSWPSRIALLGLWGLYAWQNGFFWRYTLTRRRRPHRRF